MILRHDEGGGQKQISISAVTMYLFFVRKTHSDPHKRHTEWRYVLEHRKREQFNTIPWTSTCKLWSFEDFLLKRLGFVESRSCIELCLHTQYPI